MANLAKPSAASSRTLEAVALAMKLVPRDLKNEINRATRAELNPSWRDAVNYAARSKMDKLVLAKGARIKPGNPVVLTAATSRKPLSGGLVPNDRATSAAWEFGTPQRQEYTGYDRKNKNGGTHTVRRRTRIQLPYKNSGRVVYAAAAEMIPRLTSLWVQTVVRKIYEAHEKRG